MVQKFLFGLVSILLFIHVSFAQSTSTIQGTVTDTSGAIVPNATIVVHNTATGEDHRTVSDNAGVYSVPGLHPGVYRVTASAPNLQTVIANNVVLQVGTAQAQNFTLSPAAAQTEVQVTGAAPVIASQTISVGSVINQQTVQEIPLNGRHFMDLALLAPGSVTPPQNGFLTTPLRGQGSFGFNTAGGREDQVNYMINGINLSDPVQNQITFSRPSTPFRNLKSTTRLTARSTAAIPARLSISPRAPAPTNFTAKFTSFCATTGSTRAISPIPRASRWLPSSATSSAATAADPS